ncbi:M28 family peptidase [candidate division KSB1 bacterium]|nr:M28 family peptidase [candidate division KSB1 bacterium]
MEIDRIWRDLAFLADQPRFAESPRLKHCREYCGQQLEDAGWTVTEQSFEQIGADGRTWQGVNLVASFGGVAAEQTARTFLVVGAHLDSKPETPGADDNASAVAVLLELARQLPACLNAESRIVPELVVFDLEELGMLGGAFHAAQCRAAERKLHGMISLEMLGYCDPRDGSQQIPLPLAGKYPDVGNFIAIVGNQNSTSLIDEWKSAFLTVPELPVESLEVPENGRLLPPTRLSDHSPFWDEGYPALMLTDTSFLRNPHYHQPSDTIDTLNREFLHRVARGTLAAVYRSLATAPANL